MNAGQVAATVAMVDEEVAAEDDNRKAVSGIVDSLLMPVATYQPGVSHVFKQAEDTLTAVAVATTVVDKPTAENGNKKTVVKVAADDEMKAVSEILVSLLMTVASYQ